MAVNINFHQAFPNLLSYVLRFPVCVCMANILVAFPKAFFSIFCMFVCEGVCVCVRVFVHCQIASLRNFPHFAEARAIYIACTLPLSLSHALSLPLSLRVSTVNRVASNRPQERKQKTAVHVRGRRQKQNERAHQEKQKHTHTKIERETRRESVC